MNLNTLYACLLDRFGPQYWWPADSPLEVMVGAILTQNTNWQNAARAIENLKQAGHLCASSIRELAGGELAAIIRPSGYYFTKARKLKSLAHWLAESFGDDISALSEVPTPVLRQRLLGVWGIGPETADSILLYATGRPVFVIDAYTRRIIDRLGLTPESGRTYGDYQNLFTGNLPADAHVFAEFHALLVKLAKTACLKKPACNRCPLDDCRYKTGGKNLSLAA